MKQHRLAGSIHSSNAIVAVTLTILGFSTSSIFSTVIFLATVFLFVLLMLLNKFNKTASSVLVGLSRVLWAEGFNDNLGKLAMQHRCRVRFRGEERKGIPLLTCCQFSLTDHRTKEKCKARLKNVTLCGPHFP